jgi:hypothetical protein
MVSGFRLDGSKIGGQIAADSAVQPCKVFYCVVFYVTLPFTRVSVCAATYNVNIVCH